MTDRTITDISKTLGVSRATIHNLIKFLKLEPKKEMKGKRERYILNEEEFKEIKRKINSIRRKHADKSSSIKQLKPTIESEPKPEPEPEPTLTPEPEPELKPSTEDKKKNQFDNDRMNIPEEITIIPPPEPEQVLPQSQPQLETPSEKKPSVEQILDEMKTEEPLPEEPLPEVLEFPITEEECQMWLISGYSIPMLYYDVDVTETTERLAKIRGKQLYFILKRYKILEKIKYIDILLLVIGIGGDITIIARECKATNQEVAKQKTAAEGEVVRND